MAIQILRGYTLDRLTYTVKDRWIGAPTVVGSPTRPYREIDRYGMMKCGVGIGEEVWVAEE